MCRRKFFNLEDLHFTAESTLGASHGEREFFRNETRCSVGKCGIDKKPLTFLFSGSASVGVLFSSTLAVVLVWREEGKRKSRSWRHEEWKWARTQLHKFPRLTLNFHGAECVGVGGKEFLHFYVSRRGNESDSRPTGPIWKRVFLDRLLRHSTFSSCFPFYSHTTRETRTAPSSENVHDYINGRRWGWLCI